MKYIKIKNHGTPQSVPKFRRETHLAEESTVTLYNPSYSKPLYVKNFQIPDEENTNFKTTLDYRGKYFKVEPKEEKTVLKMVPFTRTFSDDWLNDLNQSFNLTFTYGWFFYTTQRIFFDQQLTIVETTDHPKIAEAYYRYSSLFGKENCIFSQINLDKQKGVFEEKRKKLKEQTKNERGLLQLLEYGVPDNEYQYSPLNPTCYLCHQKHSSAIEEPDNEIIDKYNQERTFKSDLIRYPEESPKLRVIEESDE